MILISIDTCRADALGCYGAASGATPRLDALAGEAVLFRHVVSPVPLTLPAHSTMLTGTLPPTHGVHSNVGARLGRASRTLAELLAQEDYRTAAVVSKFVLSSRYGIDQGFETYRDDFTGEREPHFEHERRAGETARLAREWLDAHGQEPFFLFVHFFDPHHEYVPPEPFASRFAGDPYAGEVAYTDHCIGEIFDKLDDLGLYDSCLIVVTSDHGESFGEHGEETHGYFVYDSTIKVPLIVKLPGSRGDRSHVSRGRAVEDLVGLVDVTPTILARLGIAAPRDIQGEDLSDLLAGRSPQGGRRFRYCESLFPTSLGCDPLHGLVGEEWKFISTARSELYDLNSDPAEEHDRSGIEPELVARLRERLDAILRGCTPLAEDAGGPRTDTKSLERLHGIGYLGAAASVPGRKGVPHEAGDDPKDYVELWNLLVEMLDRREAGKDEEVRELCDRILEIRPGIGIAHEILGSLHERAGRLDSAIEHFRKAVDGGYGSELDQAAHHFSLASALLHSGEMSEAIALLGEAVKLNPYHEKAYCQLGAALSMTGRIEDARRHFEKAIAIDGEYGEAFFHLGNLLLRTGQTAEALERLRSAVRLSPTRPEPMNTLAWTLVSHPDRRYHDPAEAVVLAERACTLSGRRQPDCLQTLAVAYKAAGRRDDAVRTAQEALGLARESGRQGLVKKLTEMLRLMGVSVRSE